MTTSVEQPTALLPGEVRMPMIGFGTWQATGRTGYEAVRSAIEAGYRHVDTATAYGNEAEVGRAVGDSGVPREDIFLTTKLPPDRFGQERETIEASLTALGTDYVDLWLIHSPPPDQGDIETWREFLGVRNAGLARAIGVSNYGTDRLDVLTLATDEAPAVNQIRWSPSRYDPQRLAEHRDRGIQLEAYSPLKTSDLRDRVLVRIAEAHGVTPPQVVMRWHLDHGIVVLAKSVDPERIRTNIDVFGFSLTDDELSEIDALSR
jgi:diketogulonate reductase-like aldo/keto reductase